jgi:hypothetical protein
MKKDCFALLYRSKLYFTKTHKFVVNCYHANTNDLSDSFVFGLKLFISESCVCEFNDDDEGTTTQLSWSLLFTTNTVHSDNTNFTQEVFRYSWRERERGREEKERRGRNRKRERVPFSQ